MGWGDFIHQFIDSTKITVENHARGGTSSRTYMAIGLWDSVQQQLKKGDFVLIQFGHNDDGPINDDFRARGTLKGIGNETEEIDNMLTGEHEIVHTYGWYLNQMITQAKAKGALPILVSPIPRNKWTNDQVIRNQHTYGLWARQVAEKNEVPFLDLNDRMASKMEEIGEAVVTGNHFYERDPVHTSARGAVLAASVLMNEVRDAKIDLEDYLIDYPQIKLPKKRNLYLIGDARWPITSMKTLWDGACHLPNLSIPLASIISMVPWKEKAAVLLLLKDYGKLFWMI